MQREPHLNNAALMARRRAALPSGLGQGHEIFVDRAEGAEVWDVEGRRDVDFAGGIAVLNRRRPQEARRRADERHRQGGRQARADPAVLRNHPTP